MNEDRRRKAEELAEAVLDLPMSAQVKALERMIALLASRARDGALLRPLLEKASDMSAHRGPPELDAVILKLRAARAAGQDDEGLLAALREAFPLSKREGRA